MYQDAGNKNPERYLVQDAQVEQMQQQFEEQIQQIQQQAEEAFSQLEEELAGLALNDEEHDVDVATLQMKIEEERLRKEQVITALKETQERMRGQQERVASSPPQRQ